MNSLKKEMIDFLKKEYEGLTEIDDCFLFSCEAAIYWFASDYHSGQASELYSILSTSPYTPSILHNSVHDGDEMDVELYLLLVERYGKIV